MFAYNSSPYGIGAVLSQWMDDGSEKSVAFVTHSLMSAGKRCDHLDKEELSIIFGIKKFHQYLYGIHFQIVSDHNLLTYILSEFLSVPALASVRIQR